MPVIVQQAIFTLESFHNKFLCFERQDQSGKVLANRKVAKKQEAFLLVPIPNVSENEEVYYIKNNALHTFLSSASDGNVSQVPASPLSTNEQWRIIPSNRENDYINWGFQNKGTGKFLCAEKDGKVICNREKQKKFETWKMRQISNDRVIEFDDALKGQDLVTSQTTVMGLAENVSSPEVLFSDMQCLEVPSGIQVDLKEPAFVTAISICGPIVLTYQVFFSNFWIMVGNQEFADERDPEKAQKLAAHIEFVSGGPSRVVSFPKNVVGRYIRIQRKESKSKMIIRNLAIRGSSYLDPMKIEQYSKIPYAISLANNMCAMSSQHSRDEAFPAYYALNWDKQKYCQTDNQFQPYWQVSLDQDTVVSGIELINRRDAFQDRLSNFKVSITGFANQELWSEVRILQGPVHYFFPPNVKGKLLQVQLLDTNYLHFAFLGIKSNVNPEESESDVSAEPSPAPGPRTRANLTSEIPPTNKNSSSPLSSSGSAPSPKDPSVSASASAEQTQMTEKPCPKCNGLGGFDAFRPCSPTSLTFKTACPSCSGVGMIPQDFEVCQDCQGKGGIGVFGPCEIVPRSVHFQNPCPSCSGKCFLSQEQVAEEKRKLEEKKQEEERKKQEEAKRLEEEKNQEMKEQYLETFSQVTEAYQTLSREMSEKSALWTQIEREEQLKTPKALVEQAQKKLVEYNSIFQKLSQLESVLSSKDIVTLVSLEDLGSEKGKALQIVTQAQSTISEIEKRVLQKRKDEERNRLEEEARRRKEFESEDLVRSFDKKKEKDHQTHDHTVSAQKYPLTYYLAAAFVLLLAYWWIS